MSGDVRCSRVGVTRSSRGRRSEEMTQSNALSPRGQKFLLSLRGCDGKKVPQNEDISGGGKSEEKKETRFCYPSKKSI